MTWENLSIIITLTLFQNSGWLYLILYIEFILVTGKVYNNRFLVSADFAQRSLLIFWSFRLRKRSGSGHIFMIGCMIYQICLKYWNIWREVCSLPQFKLFRGCWTGLALKIFTVYEMYSPELLTNSEKSISSSTNLTWKHRWSISVLFEKNMKSACTHLAPHVFNIIRFAESSGCGFWDCT